MPKDGRPRGQVLPLIALSLGVLMGFAGMGVDVGFLEYRQQAQQTATDAAALGGAQTLARTNCAANVGAKSVAVSDAANNGFSNGGSITVAAVSPPQSGPYTNNPCAVAVQITTSNTSTFFSRLFGYSNGMPESTQSVAMASTSNASCIYLLNPSQNSDFSNSNIDAPQCGITINASANMSNSTINAASIGVAGTTPNTSGATFPGASPSKTLPVADPCPEISGCSYLSNNPPSTSGCGAGGTYNNYALQPGCYSKLTLTGTDTMAPGIYVINGQFHMNNATVSGSGVTIYMTANVSDTNFSSAHLTLSPPTSGSTSGVLMYRVPTQTSALDISTCTCSLTGLLYFPATQVNYSNTGDNYTVLVFGNANFSTSHGIDFGDPTGQALVARAVVVQ